MSFKKKDFGFLLSAAVVIFSLAIFPSTAVADDSDTLDGITAVLIDAGIEKSTATEVTENLSKVFSSGDISQLKVLINSGERAGDITVAMLGTIKPGRMLLVKLLEGGGIDHPEVIIYSLLFAEEKEVVECLVKFGGQSESAKKATLFVLKTLCGQDIDDLSEWSEWWAENRAGFEFADLDSEARGRALADAARQMQRDKMDCLSKIFKAKAADAKTAESKKAAETIDKMCGMLDSMGDMMDSGAAVKLSANTKQAVKFFRSGDYAAAEKSFHKALQINPDDRWALYLLGSVLIEVGRLHEAETVFSRIIHNEKKAGMARFLRRYCRRRSVHHEEDVLDALVLLANDTKFDEGSLYGWDDEFLGELLGQSMNDEGLFVIDQKEVTKVLEANSGNPEIVIGISFMHRHEDRLAFLESNSKKFRNSVLYQAVCIDEYMVRGFDSYEKALKLCRHARKLDPHNSFFTLLELYLEDDIKARKKGVKPGKTLFDKKSLKLVERAVNMPEFNSYTADRMAAVMLTAKKTGSPFAEMLGGGAAISAYTPNFMCMTLLKRLKLNIADDMAADDSDAAIAHANLILKLARRIKPDNNLVINLLIVSAMEEAAYYQLGRIYKDIGMTKESKAAESARLKIRTWRRSLGRRMSAAGYFFVIPVPQIQQAIVAAMAEDEVGMTLHFAGVSEANPL